MAKVKPRLLDLFAGAGGCAVGYARAGFEVVGVDIADQPNYPYEFHKLDAMEVAPLEDPIQLCGSSFGLPLRRHRLFETNFPIMAPPCAHGAQEKRFDIYEHGKWRKSATPAIYGKGGRKAVEHWPEALGIDWMTRDEMAQAIPPAYTEFIGGYLMAAVKQANPVCW